MLRRLAAMTAMIVLVAALLLLTRRVYLHHQATGSEDEPTASEVRSVPEGKGADGHQAGGHRTVLMEKRIDFPFRSSGA
jgi:hypothetical protein